MGFFNNVYTEGAYQGSDFDTLLNDPVQPSDEYLEFDEAALVAVAESEENYNSIIRAIGINEASYYARTGKEMVYTEGALGSIFTSIKNFLKKVWEKIKALFKRFLMMFDKYSKDDKAFLKKYEKAVRRASGEEIEFKGYPFESAKLKDGWPFADNDFNLGGVAVNTIITSFNTQASSLETEVDKFREDPEPTYDKLRAKACGDDSGEVTSGEFSKELFEATHGASSKESLDGTDLSAENAISILNDTKGDKKKLEDTFKKADKKINKEWIKAVEEKEKAALKEGAVLNEESTTSPGSNKADKNQKTHLASALLNYLHTASSIITQVNGALLTAYKDKNRQARSICAKYIAKGKTYNAVGESASYSGSFLADIKFK